MATILVCTRREDFLAELGPLLRSEHRVAIVPHLAEVVRSLLLTRVDALVLDIDEALAQHIDILPVVARLDPRIPVLAVSQTGAPNAAACLQAAGISCFLVSSLAAGELEGHLAAVLRWRADEVAGFPRSNDANAAATAR